MSLLLVQFPFIIINHKSFLIAPRSETYNNRYGCFRVQLLRI